MTASWVTNLATCQIDIMYAESVWVALILGLHTALVWPVPPAGIIPQVPRNGWEG